MPLQELQDALQQFAALPDEHLLMALAAAKAKAAAKAAGEAAAAAAAAPEGPGGAEPAAEATGGAAAGSGAADWGSSAAAGRAGGAPLLSPLAAAVHGGLGGEDAFSMVAFVEAAAARVAAARAAYESVHAAKLDAIQNQQQLSLELGALRWGPGEEGGGCTAAATSCCDGFRCAHARARVW